MGHASSIARYMAVAIVKPLRRVPCDIVPHMPILRLGFDICGFDTTLYRGTSAEGETAVYMARLIGAA